MVAAHAAAALSLSQVSLAAAPRTLTLSYVSSDRSAAYLSLVKPFVDAINNDPRSLLKIAVRFSGQAGPLKQQPSLVSTGKAMLSIGFPAIALLSLPAAQAAPARLKLSFFASERGDTYRYAVKPFVDAINAEGQGLVAIDVQPNNARGRSLAEQPRLVLDGRADIAFIFPGQTPYRFPDDELLELPGLFRNAREGTLVYTRLIASKALRGYECFYVIGAYTSAPNIISSRKPIRSLADLKGQKIRANNPMQAELLARLGAIPTVMSSSKVADAIRRGALDGTFMCPAGLFQWGVAPLVEYHFLLDDSVSPSALVMSRKSFDALPEAAKALIRKHSGDHAADAWIGSYAAIVQQRLAQLRADPNRMVVEPSRADRDAVRRVYRSLTGQWAATSAHHRELLALVKAEIAKLEKRN
jgi:TRAP-type C4-dicarboxylate transport system substrate-binding protein